MGIDWRFSEQDLVDGVQETHAVSAENASGGGVEQVLEDAGEVVGARYGGGVVYSGEEFRAFRKKKYGGRPEYEVAWQTDRYVADAAALLGGLASQDHAEVYFRKPPYVGKTPVEDLYDKRGSIGGTGHIALDVDAFRVYTDRADGFCWSEEDGSNLMYFVGRELSDSIPGVVSEDTSMDTDEAEELYHGLRQKLEGHSFDWES